MPRRSSLADLKTPALVLDVDVLQRNVARMAEKARRLGVRLRPHVKTHKCVEIGRLQRDAGSRGVTVATLAEAETFADAGFDDITWAFPVITGRLDEVTALARRVVFRIVVDSGEAAAAAAGAARAAGVLLHVWLKVDCGYHRAGVDPGSPAGATLAQRIAGAGGLVFDGILTHAGHAYGARSREELQRVAREERDVMVNFARRLREAGVEVPEVSIGSTPSLSVAERLDGVTEIRPGNYVFYDYMQVASGVARLEDCAVSVVASVVSHQPGADHVVLDAGALALSKDLGPRDPARARGLGPLFASLDGDELHPRLEVRSVSQEHGIVAGSGPADVAGRFAVGERVRILPNHSCLTAALFDRYTLLRGGEVVGHWPIARGR